MLLGYRVLAVDPDDDIASLYATLLSRHRADFRVASSGEAALAQVTAAWWPDVLLVHLRLPDMTAAELAHTVRSRVPSRVRVVCTTAEARPGVVEATFRDAGFDAVLVKPIEIDALLSALGIAGALTG